MAKKRKRKITKAMRKKAFLTFARWLVDDDKRIRDFMKALRRSPKGS